MSENTEIVEVAIYYYFNDKNQRMYTSNPIFAESRAQYYGTNEVFVEKV